MEKRQFDSNNFTLFSPDSLKYITNELELILQSSLDFYKKLFNVDSFRKIQINYFDDIQNFREYINNLRGAKSLPTYAIGTFDKGMINAFIDSNIIMGSPQFIKKQYMASHELFHIMYNELILKKEHKERIVWFDEGMAQLFSGENNVILDDNNFKEWFNKVISKTTKIPNLNELKHGNAFETEDYSGYNLSFIAVKYLYETLAEEEFKLLMHDIDKVKGYGQDLINDAINYYSKN